MDFQSNHSDDRVLSTLGQRIERTRLRRGWTQADLAREAGVSKRTIERLEDGASVQATSLIRTLRALDRLAGLGALLPDPKRSPIEEADGPKGERRRARSVKSQRATPPSPEETSEWQWGDEA